jgi:hypothetical protein
MLEGLKYPSSFLRSVTLDTTVKEYNSLLLKERIYEKYNEKYDYDFSNPSINSRINTKEDNLFDYIYRTIISYKKSSNFLNIVYKFEVIKEQYDAKKKRVCFLFAFLSADRSARESERERVCVCEREREFVW